MTYFQQEHDQQENYYHDHSSDRDSDDDMLQPRRSCSFSEAEGMLGGSQYYESFTMESSPPRSSNGLHHRSRNHTYSANSQDGTRLDLEDDKKQLHHKKHKLSSKKRHRVLQIFIVVIGLYILLIAKSLLWMYQNNDYTIYLSPNDSYAILPISTQTSTWAQQQHQKIVLRGGDFKQTLERRSDDRFRRSRPPLPSSHGRGEGIATDWYSIDRLQQLPRNKISRERINMDKRETLSKDQLCGNLAKSAFGKTPGFFSTKSAVNKNSVVVITGILNPLGYSLALHLKEQCDVQKVIGIDNMYPNTVGNRLKLLDRMQLLSSAFPKMPKPIFLSFIGVDPLYKKGSSTHKSSHDEMDLSDLKPTHIVHLSSFSQDVYSNDLVRPDWLNTHSPYIDAEHERDPYLYQMRTSMVSMEQILSSFVDNTNSNSPQFLYASSTGGVSEDARQATTKLIDEILADTYHMQSDFPSIGLRLPNAVYGPWGQPGSFVHDAIEWAVRSWNEAKSFSFPTNLTDNRSGRQLDMLYVDDVVEAILGAMQYKVTKPISVDLNPETVLEKEAFTDALKAFMPKQSNEGMKAVSKFSKAGSRPDFLGWKPQTTLLDGMVRTIAWHLDRDTPFGSPTVTGDTFLKQNKMKTCAADDLICHKGYRYLPCASECSINDQCLPSIFDSVRDTMREATQGCDMVLYTQSIGHNIQDMRLEAEYLKDVNLIDGDNLVCNLAIVPKDSDLVAQVIDKVPRKQLPTFELSSEATRQQKLKGLNGRLVYRGWILIWVPGATGKVSHADQSLLKLSPGQFFFSGVQKALFVEENFSAPIQNDDCLFLVDELSRSTLKERSVKKKIESVGKRVVYKLPSEPKRRAAILLSPLRYPNNIDDPTVKRFRSGEKKLTIIDATKFMRYEAGYDYLERESSAIRNQRQFYERVPSYVNREKELRSNMEPFYRYIMRHWVRTRWVLHDVNMEASRLLRCDWYREHVQWGAEIDQLSFAHVMALREVKRRIAHEEADDHVKTYIEENPELKPYTDSYEWHAMETETNRLYREPIQWQAEIPAHIVAQQENRQVEDEDEPNRDDEDEALFIRIMSERMMAISRKRWAKKRKLIKKLNEKKD